MFAASAIPSTLPSADPDNFSAKNPDAYQSPAGLCLRLCRRAKRPLYETIGSVATPVEHVLEPRIFSSMLNQSLLL